MAVRLARKDKGKRLTTRCPAGGAGLSCLFTTMLLLTGVGLAQSAEPATTAPPAAALPVWSTAQTQPNRFLAAHGLRGFAAGYSEDGLEFWSFPLQLVSEYRLEFELPDAAAVPALSLLTSVEVDPLGVTRVYRSADFEVRERLATHAEDAGVSVRYAVAGRRDLRIKAHFRPSLNLMWPAGFGGQEIAWDKDARGFLLSEPTHRFRALVASPEAGEHSETTNDRRNSEFGRPLAITLEPKPCAAGQCATLVFAGQSEPNEDVHATATALLRAATAADTEGAERYRLASAMRITTPDAEANRAMRWAQIALEQAWSCNPRLGCGTVAGYGPSRGARRPQYAWYFAGDGLVATEAFLREGEFRRAAAELGFLFRYQNPENGMMWHELSQSAGFLNWARDYPYLYVHVDITFDFLSTLAQYVRATGDRDLVRQHWDAIQRAYGYCLSTLDAKDGLPRVPADKLSADEQDRLTDALTLSAAWVGAAHGMAELALAMGNPALAGQAETASQHARRSIAARYWDGTAQRWVGGFTQGGAATESTSGGDLAAITSGAATPEQAEAILEALETPPYHSAWGLRGTPSTSPNYRPTAYAKGSVSCLLTAAAAEVMWQSRHAETANRMWGSLVPWAQADSLGHMHELMSGSFFEAQRESVPEQTWSSAGFLSAAIHGLLGLEPDASARSLTFAPQPPSAWKDLQVEQIALGQSSIGLDWHEEKSQFTLIVHNAGVSFHLRWIQGRAEGGAPIVLTREIPPGETRLHLP